MENTRPNIESLKKADRNEKILVISLLLISMAVAFFAFNKSSQMATSAPAEIEGENPDAIFHQTPEATGTTNDKVDSGIQTENAQKEGVLAVGLYSTMENANKVIATLDSLGFQGVAKTREDGKIVVGVPANANEADLINSVKETYSDAIYIKN